MMLDEENLGIPVIAIGVPTVVDAATLVNDIHRNSRMQGNVDTVGNDIRQPVDNRIYLLRRYKHISRIRS